jgi:murein DD-endopeptidase MepM/ murein hydrolase activator NlpD
LLSGFFNKKKELERRLQRIKRPARLGKGAIILSVIALFLSATLLLPMSSPSPKVGPAPFADDTYMASPIKDGVIVLEYGLDTESPSHFHEFHNGIDVLPPGSPSSVSVLAAADGIVVSSDIEENSPAYREVTIMHSGEFSTRYANLSHVFFTLGQSVKKGQKIGIVPGPLHFEVLYKNNNVDPEKYLFLKKDLIRQVKKLEE